MDELRLDSLEGVGPVTTKKLTDAGIHNIMDLLVRGPVEVAEITGMDKETAEKIVNKARQQLVEEGLIAKDFVSATEIYKRRQDIGKISTGTNCLDLLFDGGVETQALTEVYGEFGSGKTQFCHTMCVNVQKPKEQGGQEAGPIIKEHNVKLIVADSAAGLFRAEYLGRGTLSERQQRLNKFVHLLVRTAETYNCAAIATNQVMSSPDVFFGDPTRPIGGNIVAHTSTYRVYFKKSGKKRIARMVDSPHHPEQEVIFMLTEAGISDPEEDTKKKKKEETE